MDKSSPDEALVIDGYLDWCQALRQGNSQALLLLALDDLFMQSCIFDPRTGDGGYNDLEHFLDDVLKGLLEPKHLDHLSWIVQYSLTAIEHLLRGVREELVREHELLPVEQVSQTDSASIIWLSRLQGRTIKEKLSGKRQMLAPVRNWTIDTAENRLFKVFLERLNELNEAKAAALGSADDFYEQVAAQITRWLASDEVRAMRRWANLPPNNVLLADKYYRKIWDSWEWIRSIDDSCRVEAAALPDKLLQSAFWVTAAALHELSSVRFLQVPCVFSMRSFTAVPVSQVSSLTQNKLYLAGFWENNRFALEYKHDEVVFTIPSLQCRVSGNASGLTLHYSQDESQHEHTVTIAAGESSILQLHKALSNILRSLPLSTVRAHTNKDVALDPDKTDSSARYGLIDLSQMRPHYALVDEEPRAEQQLPYRLLGQFCDSDKCGRVFLDCSLTEGLLLTEHNPVLSPYDLFSGEKTDHEMFAAAQLFFSKLHDEVRCTQACYYLVPDAADEIALSTVRRQLNLYFPNAQPLPRSIATVFALLKSCPDAFAGHNQVLVMCASLFGTQLVITPLLGTRETKIQTKLPQAGGMLWEHYPSNIYSPPELKQVYLSILPAGFNKQACKQMSFAFADIPALENVGVSFADTEQETGQKADLSFWLFEPQKVQELSSLLTSVQLKAQMFFADIQQQMQLKDDIPLFFISADSALQLQDEPELEVRNLGGFSPVTGGAQLIAWQQLPNSPDLWKDHLPELFMRASVNGITSYVPLVRSSKAVLPHFGECFVVTKVEFSLPQGKDLYQFPLTKSERGKPLRYQMQITSPAFPLNADVTCDLEVLYTYGAEQPYRLLVKPKSGHKAPFQQIEAQWVNAESIKRNSPVPQLPAALKWANLRRYPSNRGSSDVIAWMLREFGNVHNLCKKYLSVLDGTQQSDDIRLEVENFASNVSVVRKNGEFGFLSLPDGKEVFFHPREYYGHGSLWDQEVIYFTLTKTDNGYKACDISDTIGASWLEDRANKLQKSLRFPSIQIWRDGRSINDADAPQQLRDAVETFEQDLQVIERLGLLDSKLGQECSLCAARMHKDAVWFQALWQKLELISASTEKPDNLGFYVDMLGSAIGDLSLPVQQRIHDNLLMNISTWKINALAQAYWRCPDVVTKLTAEQVKTLGQAVYSTLNSMLHNDSTKPGYKTTRKIMRLCELLLALLRTRGSQDPQISQVLDANGDLAAKLIEAVDNLQQYYSQHPFPMNTFVRLNLDKPESWKNMPDLLYAVYMYLSGDDGADDIMITAIVDDVDE